MDQTQPRYPVTCEIDGKTYKGKFWIAGKILIVSTGMAPTENLAKELLRELVKEGKA